MPYFTEEMAHGLAFSTKSESTPSSLENIFREINTDMYPLYEFGEFRKKICPSNDLTPWAKSGVLLLNTILTVEEDKPLSHEHLGWQMFTEEIIRHLAQDNPNRIVFMLWGQNARKYTSVVRNNKNLVLEAAHPSPNSADRGFFGCRHFSQANDFLCGGIKEPVDMSSLKSFKHITDELEEYLKEKSASSCDRKTLEAALCNALYLEERAITFQT